MVTTGGSESFFYFIYALFSANPFGKIENEHSTSTYPDTSTK